MLGSINRNGVYEVVKEGKVKTRIFRWNESKKRSVVINGVFNPNVIATGDSIELKRKEKEKLFVRSIV